MPGLRRPSPVGSATAEAGTLPDEPDRRLELTMNRNLLSLAFYGCVIESLFGAYLSVTEIPTDGNKLLALPQVQKRDVAETGQPATAESVLKNDSSHPINILDVKHSCGCTSHTPEQTRIPPRSSVAYLMRLETRSLKEAETAMDASCIRYKTLFPGRSAYQPEAQLVVYASVRLSPSDSGSLPGSTQGDAQDMAH